MAFTMPTETATGNDVAIDNKSFREYLVELGIDLSNFHWSFHSRQPQNLLMDSKDIITEENKKDNEVVGKLRNGKKRMAIIFKNVDQTNAGYKSLALTTNATLELLSFLKKKRNPQDPGSVKLDFHGANAVKNAFEPYKREIMVKDTFNGGTVYQSSTGWTCAFPGYGLLSNGEAYDFSESNATEDEKA